MRSAKLFDQQTRSSESGGGRRGDPDRRTRGPKPDWFLHDDRDAEPKASPSRRTDASAAPTARMWEYKDLDGQMHGPFSSEKMRQWVAKGYFQPDLQVRQADGTRSWADLSQLMPLMSERPAAKPLRQPADDRRVSAFERLTSGAGGDTGGSGQMLQAPRRGGSGRDGGRGAGRDGGSRRGSGRGGRGQHLEEHGGAEDGRQRQRGGRGRGAGKSPKAAQAKRLFTNKAALAADQPLWRYVDLSGTVQGPFTAANMTEWYARGYLSDENLLLIGHDRQVAPPNLPPLTFYQPLGKLLEQGEKYMPFTAEDIKRHQAESAASGAAAGSADSATDDDGAAAPPAEPSDTVESDKPTETQGGKPVEASPSNPASANDDDVDHSTHAASVASSEAAKDTVSAEAHAADESSELEEGQPVELPADQPAAAAADAAGSPHADASAEAGSKADASADAGSEAAPPVEVADAPAASTSSDAQAGTHEGNTPAAAGNDVAKAAAVDGAESGAGHSNDTSAPATEEATEE